ncbi:MAG: pentapeptide repeat-containing protein [Methylotenera sp.]|nr:pentapeptide repeat-containing protein [Methylotenera sp.]MSP99106.1 pentapeptide repeat-containing protein [Methylotenera sp.]
MTILKQLILVFGLSFTSIAIAGEFGDHCTTGLFDGVMIKTKCEINVLYESKTYCFGSKASRETFLLTPDTIIAKATTFFAKNAEPMREKISQADALKQINSSTCDLSNKDASYLVFNGMNLSHCNMQNISFFGAELMGAKLKGANLQDAYLNLARLENADLSDTNLTNATIFQAIFDKTNFQSANLTNARMIGTLGNVNMSDATIIKGRFGLDIGNQPMGAMRFDAIGGKFSNSNFEGADINRSNFKFANFRNANLRHTNLFRADFSKADLTGADITGAKMGEAVLDETIMTNVKGLEAIIGYDEAKGKCIDCKITVKLSQIEMMTAENTATKLCNVRGARF